MKRFLFALVPLLILAGCSASKSPENTAACKEQCKQELVNDISIKEKCRDSGNVLLGIINKSATTVDDTAEIIETFYSKSRNSCMVKTVTGALFSGAGISRLDIYDSLSSENLASYSYSYSTKDTEFILSEKAKFEKIENDLKK
jgi:hypothetical protein